LKKIEENIKIKVDPVELEKLTEESISEFETVSILVKEHIAKIN
jgi:hypothetical protein